MDIPVGTLLKEWQSYVTAISRNLLELSEQNDVKIIRIKVKDGVNGYTGLTRNMAEKACDGLDTLWRYYAILSGVADKAADLYGKSSFLHNTEDEVRELLENTPVTLESQRIDIKNRDLLSPENNDTKVNLREMLKYMQDSFESTRDIFSEISHASSNLQKRLEVIKTKLDSLNNTARNLGLDEIPGFDASKIRKIGNDPLQSLRELDSIEDSMEKSMESIRTAERDYKDTIDILNSVRNMISEIEETSEKSRDAVSESMKIFDSYNAPKPVIGIDVLDSLRDWLDVLQNKLSAGGLNAAKIGAQKLMRECISKLETEKKNYEFNTRDYNELMDIKGEFKALLAKYQGLKSRGIVFENSIEILIQDIESSLYSDKVNLKNCKGLLGKFHMSLNG